MTDEEIVRLVQNGDREKYGEIVERYENKLYRYLKGITNQDNETIEDLTEETLIKAYENIMAFDCRKKFGSWIYRIGHNTAIDFFKKKKIYKLYEDKEEILVDKKKTSEEEMIDEERLMELKKSIDKLEVKYKEVVWLYYFEEKDYDEISEVLHTTKSNVGVMLNRAKMKLKKFMILKYKNY